MNVDHRKNKKPSSTIHLSRGAQTTLLQPLKKIVTRPPYYPELQSPDVEPNVPKLCEPPTLASKQTSALEEKLFSLTPGTNVDLSNLASHDGKYYFVHKGYLCCLCMVLALTTEYFYEPINRSISQVNILL